MIQFNFEEEEEEEGSQVLSPQFQRAMPGPTAEGEFFSFHGKPGDDYRDHLIRELISRNNELEQFTANYH